MRAAVVFEAFKVEDDDTVDTPLEGQLPLKDAEAVIAANPAGEDVPLPSLDPQASPSEDNRP